MSFNKDKGTSFYPRGGRVALFQGVVRGYSRRGHCFIKGGWQVRIQRILKDHLGPAAGPINKDLLQGSATTYASDNL